jgi:hypothetical protein
MAGTYITVADINNRHFQQFPEADKQDIVDRANAQLEILAIRRRVQADEIVTPVSNIVKRYLEAWAVRELATDNAYNDNYGVESDASKYSKLWYMYNKRVNEYEGDVTYWVLTDTVTEYPQTTAHRSRRMLRSR